MNPTAQRLESSAPGDDPARLPLAVLPAPDWSDDLPTPRQVPGTVLARGWLEGGLAVLDTTGKVVEINESFCQWLERPAAELAGQSLWSLLAGRCPDWQEPLEKLGAEAATFRHLKLRRPVTGFLASQWYALELTRIAAGAVVRLNSILPPLADLEEATWNEYLRGESAQREMFVRLLRAEAQLKSLTQRWPGVIFSQRADFTFRFVSPKIVELTGLAPAEWQGKPHLFWQLVHEGDAEELRAQLQHAVKTRQAVTNTYRIRQAQTGRVTYVLEHREPMVSSGGLLLGYEGVWLDVTRQTIAEKRLSTAAWKETLSVLTMGLAHDFGNVMAGIHALSESYLAQIEPRHEFAEGLTLIKTNSMQASQLVHRIINLHQGKTGDSYYHNLNDLAADLADLVRKIIPRRMEFATEFTDTPLALYIDAVEFRQVVINLVLNAIDAMPQTGRLVLRTSYHEQLPPLAHLHGARPRLPCACLSVRDNGTGIHPRHLGSIFDPFFTTKAMNKGSGLGLYNARLFVEKHHGAISVETTEGAGTTFHLWLPQADFTEADAVASSAPAPERKSLLLAGPPGDLLEGTAEFLRIHGYHVVTTISPANALETARSADYRFAGAMILTEPGDATLAELLPELRRRQPQLRIILKLAGCAADDLDTNLIARADLVISSDLPPPGILEKLAQTI